MIAKYFSIGERKKEANNLEKLIDVTKVHSIWHHELLNYIASNGMQKMNHEFASQDNQCTLGRWIYQHESQKNIHIELLQELKQRHADFHQVAGIIISNVNTGKRAEAALLFNSHYKDVSAKMVETFNRLTDS